MSIPLHPSHVPDFVSMVQVIQTRTEAEVEQRNEQYTQLYDMIQAQNERLTDLYNLQRSATQRFESMYGLPEQALSPRMQAPPSGSGKPKSNSSHKLLGLRSGSGSGSGFAPTEVPVSPEVCPCLRH